MSRDIFASGPRLHGDGDIYDVLMALSLYTTTRKDDGPPGVEGMM